jgi:hypothetical protein
VKWRYYNSNADFVARCSTFRSGDSWDECLIAASQEAAEVCIIEQTGDGAFQQTFGSLQNWEIIVHKRLAEPDPELVARAIVRVLEIAQLQGITRAEFIQMLDSGMRIADFLRVADEFTNGHTIDCDTVN